MRLIIIMLSAILFSSFCRDELDNTLKWNENLNLTFDDFTQLKTAPPEYRGYEAGSTVTLYIEYTSKTTTAFIKPVALFSKEKSWVLAKSINSAELLAHEKLHFDIMELHARLCRQELQRTGNTFEKMELSKSIVKKYLKMAQAENEAYDIDSDHCKNKMNQLLWNNRIKGELENLEAFKE